MKTGLIAFHFAYVELMTVNQLVAIVLALNVSVRKDFDRVLSWKGGLISINAAGT